MLASSIPLSLLSAMSAVGLPVLRHFLLYDNSTSEKGTSYAHAGSSDEEEHIEKVKSLMVSFLQEVHYKRPDYPTNVPLVEWLTGEIKSWEIKDGRSWAFYVKTCQHSAAMAEMSYNLHPFEVKKQIALYTFFMIYMDDLADRMPDALTDFQRRMMLGLPQIDPVLVHFPAHLSDFYKFYDPLCANSIIAAALEYVSGTALETRKEILDMDVDKDAPNWPYFLRAKTGVAPAYAYMIFHKGAHSNIANFIQAVPDINVFIDLTNDVLSFYKEELAGETVNYIHNRARCLSQTALESHAEVAKEATSRYNHICNATASDPHAAAAWKAFHAGYITFHVSQDRYRLAEIGF